MIDKDDAALGKFAILAWCIFGALLHHLKKIGHFLQLIKI